MNWAVGLGFKRGSKGPALQDKVANEKGAKIKGIGLKSFRIQEEQQLTTRHTHNNVLPEVHSLPRAAPAP